MWFTTTTLFKSKRLLNSCGRWHPHRRPFFITPGSKFTLLLPNFPLRHRASLFGSIIIRISYGFEDVEYNKTLVQQTETLASGFSESIIPGRYLVNAFPFLKHVPSWLPGAGFKNKIESLAAVSDKTLTVYDEVKESLVSRLYAPALFRDLTDVFL